MDRVTKHPASDEGANRQAKRTGCRIAGAANDDVPLFDSDRGLRHTGHPTRSFVSAERVYNALRQRFGCMPTGGGGAAWTYWQTMRGRIFRVEDPIFDPACAPVLRADGKRSLFYSYEYANALLRRVNELSGEPRGSDGGAVGFSTRLRPLSVS